MGGGVHQEAQEFGGLAQSELQLLLVDLPAELVEDAQGHGSVTFCLLFGHAHDEDVIHVCQEVDSQLSEVGYHHSDEMHERPGRSSEAEQEDGVCVAYSSPLKTKVLVVWVDLNVLEAIIEVDGHGPVAFPDHCCKFVQALEFELQYKEELMSTIGCNLLFFLVTTPRGEIMAFLSWWSW
jgi:hypothetical protein